MKCVEFVHYIGGVRTTSIVCHDRAVDEAICSLVADAVGEWYDGTDHEVNPDFLKVARDLADILRDGYSRSRIVAWVHRHRGWMVSLAVKDLGPCDVPDGQVARLVELSRRMCHEHPAD